MWRKLINAPVAVAALGCFVMGSTIASSNIASSVGGQAYMTKVDFASAAATAVPPREDTPRITAKVDFDRAFADATAMPRREDTPRIMAKVDFDQAFADATAMPRRENTPANREKLRAAGWKRIVASR